MTLGKNKKQKVEFFLSEGKIQDKISAYADVWEFYSYQIWSYLLLKSSNDIKMSVEPFICSFVSLLVLVKLTQMTQTAVDSLSVLAGSQEYP